MKIYIETYGCSSNQSNSEIMAGLLNQAGYKIVPEDEADLIIINTCVVKKPTEVKILKRLRELSKTKKKILVAGCMVEVLRDKIIGAVPQASTMGINSVIEIADIVNKIKEGYKVIRLEDKPKPLINLPKLRINPAINIVQISQGCTGSCMFCCTRFAKGKLYSYPPHLIVSDIQNSLREGCKEIWLTSQDTSAYGLDNGIKLPALLRKIASIPGEYKVRIGMSNPFNVLPILNDLILAYKHPRIYRFLHLPIQSASDNVLKAMNRNYAVDDFKRIYYAFKKQFPDLTFSTDVIVGFPGETEEDFNKTLNFIGEIRPDIVNISMYGERPKTSIKEQEIPSWKIKERSRRLTSLVNEIKEENNKKWLNWNGNVLISAKAPKGGYMARNYAFKPILLKKGNLGEFSRISIVDARRGYLIGK